MATTQFPRETGFSRPIAFKNERLISNPLEGVPLASAAGIGRYAAHFDDFVQYAGPVAAGTGAGYTVLISTVAQEPEQHGGGVLSVTTGGQLGSDSVVYAAGLSKRVVLMSKIRTATPAADTLGIGLVTAGVNLAAADGDDEIVLEVDGPAGQLQMRTQKDGGGVVTTASTNTRLNALLTSTTDFYLLSIVQNRNNGVEGWVSTTGGETWVKAISLAATEASLPDETSDLLDAVYLHVAGTGPGLIDWTTLGTER